MHPGLSMDSNGRDVHIQTQADPFPLRSASDPGIRRPGEIVAEKYQLVRYLARGGMAEVWLGTHVSLKTEVAIKFADPQVTGDRETGPFALERFRFEAQLSARLAARTRSIVAVQDAGTHLGVPYLVMEYVPGRTLDAEVEADGPLAPARMADVLDQVADALGAAHAMGIIHRDLKPSNLMLAQDEEGKLTVKVADFGVAKALSAKLAIDKPRETQEGQLVGSPAFMSPEQLRGATQIDARSDVWSLGVVAYESLTGQPCFEGATVMDVFASITIARYRPASKVRPDLPRGVDGWLARALALDPDDRFQSIEEMASSFRALIERPRVPRRPLAAAALLAVGLLATGLVVRGRTTPAAKAAVTPQTAAVSAAPVSPGAAPTTSTTPAPVNVSDLPPADTAPKAQPTARFAPAPVKPTPPPATVAPVVTAAPVPTPTAVPEAPKPPPPPPPVEKRPPKKVDPSEIQ